MTLIEQAAYDEGFRDGVATREDAVAQEFEEKRDLELYAQRLEDQCSWLSRALALAVGWLLGDVIRWLAEVTR